MRGGTLASGVVAPRIVQSVLDSVAGLPYLAAPLPLELRMRYATAAELARLAYHAERAMNAVRNGNERPLQRLLRVLDAYAARGVLTREAGDDQTGGLPRAQ